MFATAMEAVLTVALILIGFLFRSTAFSQSGWGCVRRRGVWYDMVSSLRYSATISCPIGSRVHSGPIEWTHSRNVLVCVLHNDRMEEV